MIIAFLYSLLFFFTPLIFTSHNSEFFELPKMYFVYGLTLIISLGHLLNFLRGKAPLFRPSPYTIPLLVFLSSQIISTFLSIDIHTSIFGYYSRLNGGLLSLISYSLLFLILSVYINPSLKNKIIISSLASGLVVSLYGISQHFGVDKTVWNQDVQNRVFSSLGQPNWLAAYLCILLPLTLHQALESKKNFSLIGYWLLVILFYLCLLFTKSKSGIIAAVISLGLYTLIHLFKNKFHLKLSFIFGFLVLAIISISIPNPIKDTLFPPKVDVSKIENSTLNITPSADIRKIVWQGSLELWRQFPLFGTGPETFAYSYYWTRPAAHNLTSEWNFLYNKAHNEYLNYMATTGTFGILTYLFLILTILVTLKSTPAVLASFVSILITNSVGFSVVITSVYFFLLPALSLQPAKYVSQKTSWLSKLFSLFLITISSFLVINCLHSYLADLTYANALSFDSRQDYSSAYTQIKNSNYLRPGEPIYLSKTADILAKLAITSQDKSLANLSDSYVKKALVISPFNLNLWKESAQTYYYLSSQDSDYYIKSLESLTKVTALAPTDAISFYLLGRFYQNINATDSALSNYQQALKLKPNYDYASFAIAKIYYDQKDFQNAKPMFEKTLDIAPGNIDAQNYLNLIATSSAHR